MKKILLILLLFNLTINSNVHSIEADVFVQSTVNRASQILSENLTKNEKINRLKIIAKETVDIKGVGFYSLGSARKNLNDEEKEVFIGELVSLIKADDKVHDHEFFLLGHVANSIGYSPEKVAEVIKNKGVSGNKSSGWFSWLFG